MSDPALKGGGDLTNNKGYVCRLLEVQPLAGSDATCGSSDHSQKAP